jgi:hypothetical protein
LDFLLALADWVVAVWALFPVGPVVAVVEVTFSLVRQQLEAATRLGTSRR